MRIRLSIFLIPLLFLPSLLSAATATHSYDEVNRLVQTVYYTGNKITTIDYLYDPAGNMVKYTISANFMLGDVDDSKAVDLTDAILCLQLSAGMTPPFPLYQAADVDGDNKLGMSELIFVLGKLAEF